MTGAEETTSVLSFFYSDSWPLLVDMLVANRYFVQNPVRFALNATQIMVFCWSTNVVHSFV